MRVDSKDKIRQGAVRSNSLGTVRAGRPAPSRRAAADLRTQDSHGGASRAQINVGEISIRYTPHHRVRNL